MEDDKSTNTAVVDEKSEKDASAAPTKAKRSKKVKRKVVSGQVHIQATFNNTIITFTDSKGGSLAASSAGACGFRGSKKGTAYAAQIACDKVAEKVKQDNGMSKVDVFVSGIGLGRDAAVRAVAAANLDIQSITDTTGVPHGGCRPRKFRRP